MLMYIFARTFFMLVNVLLNASAFLIFLFVKYDMYCYSALLQNRWISMRLLEKIKDNKCIRSTFNSW